MDDESLPAPLSGGSDLPPNSETFFIHYRPQTQATQTAFNSVLAFVAKKWGSPHEALHTSTDDLSENLTDDELKCLEDLKGFEDLKDFEELKDLEKGLEELDEMLGLCLSSKEFDAAQDIQKFVYMVNDSIIEELKNEEFEEFEKKEWIDDTLGICFSSEEFNELVYLGKQITDYVWDVEDEAMSMLDWESTVTEVSSEFQAETHRGDDMEAFPS